MPEEIKKEKKVTTKKTTSTTSKKVATKKATVDNKKAEDKTTTENKVVSEKPVAKKTTTTTPKAKKPAVKKSNKLADVEPIEKVKESKVEEIKPTVEAAPIIKDALLNEVKNNNENAAVTIVAKRIKPTGFFVGSLIFLILNILLAIVCFIVVVLSLSNSGQKDLMLWAFIGVIFFGFVFVKAIMTLVKIGKNNKLVKSNIPCIEKNSEGKWILHVIKGEPIIVGEDKIQKIKNNFIVHKKRTTVYFNNDEAKIQKAAIGYVDKEDYSNLKEKFNKKN